MTTVTLVYPYFHPSGDNSIFRFPPLGLGYIAAYLKSQGVSVDVIDCTFLTQKQALERIRRSKPTIVGIQSMFSMRSKTMEMASLLKRDCQLLVAGGPLPTSNPRQFLNLFDVAVIGEGEETMLDVVRHVEKGKDLSGVRGIAYIEKGTGVMRLTPSRGFIKDLDTIPFPRREFFDNQAYKSYYSRNFGYTTTSIITSRGCPFKCDFCSRPVYGNELRQRTASNVVDEVEQVRSLGYSRVWFADDCFTLNRRRLLGFCDEIVRRRIGIGWECLSRVDTINREVAGRMKRAGCVRVFFGIESGNDSILTVMNKQATTRQAARAVQEVKKSGMQTGAFFILGYPGENAKTVLDTVRFASSLPLDYLSFTFPYPIPGTPLFERMKNGMILDDWEEPKSPRLVKHKLMFQAPISEAKLRLALLKGMVQHEIRKHTGTRGYRLLGLPFERATDVIYGLMH